MSKPQDQAATTSASTVLAPADGKDYAAWIDREGCEHSITRDMVDSMIEELVAGPDYSLQGRRLQGRGGFHPEHAAFKYLQNRPHWGE